MGSNQSTAPTHPGTAREVFWVFARLGLTSFGGPIAHLAYFRDAFVQRRRWLTDSAYADLVALCQFLPGPASSQVGMAIGLQRAGLRGLLAAWLAFTLPSAIVLTVFALGMGALGDLEGAGWLIGVKAAAVGIVAQAVMSMAKTLTPDAKRASIATAALIAVLLVPGAGIQVGVIVIGGIIGWLWLRDQTVPDDGGPPVRFGLSRRVGAVALIAFAALLVALPVLVALTGNETLRLADIFYRTGSLVFGGGHVVLPLLEAEMVPSGLVGHDEFLAGYGAAQIVPGPLFTFAAFLGASTTAGPTGILGASIVLVAIFLPAALLIIGVLPFWDQVRTAPRARRGLMGVNAAVVGLLAAALYDPVFTQGVSGPATLALAAAVFVAQTMWRVPVWATVIAAGLLGQILL